MRKKVIIYVGAVRKNLLNLKDVISVIVQINIRVKFQGLRVLREKMKKKTDYSKFTEEQLNEKIEDLEFQIMRSYAMMGEATNVKTNRKRLKKEIARIKTELNSRK